MQPLHEIAVELGDPVHVHAVHVAVGGGVQHGDLVERLHSSASDTLEKISDGDWSDETQKALDDAIAQYAEDFGYDLDEEGHPEDDGGEEPRSSSRDSGDQYGDSDNDDDSDDEESSKEPVGAGSRDE